jgi:Asp-tRNA(Asn)/Glu-tRNA(Gln) amidotransferase A subunit family amidase
LPEVNPPDFPHAPPWVAWLAQDADGAWWGYEAEPNQQHNGWYENEVGRVIRLGAGAPPDDWTARLFRRAGARY